MSFKPGDIIELATDPVTGKEWVPRNDRILIVLYVEWDGLIRACILKKKDCIPNPLYISARNQKHYKVIG